MLVLAASGGAATAAPTLHLSIETKNAFGFLAAPLCPSHGEEPGRLPLLEGCGVDPYTNSGTSLERLTGNNVLLITVGAEGLEAGKPVEVEDALPRGLVLTYGGSGDVVGLGQGGSQWSCEVKLSPNLPAETVAAKAFRCVDEKPAPEAGKLPTLAAFFFIEADAPSQLTDQVVAKTGGATANATLSATVLPTTSNGLYCLNVAVPNTLVSGEPALRSTCSPPGPSIAEVPSEAKAGGHPEALSAAFTPKLIPSPVPGGALIAPGAGFYEYPATIKEFELHLPPGFVGNPLALPRCPLTVFLDEASHGGTYYGQKPCPPESQIGFLEVRPTAPPASEAAEKHLPLPGVIGGGVNQSPIYNLVPPPGYPAAFGVVALVPKIPIVILARLASDENYAVVSGQRATATVVSVRATFCSYGAKGGENGPGSPPPGECNAPNPGKTPFFTLPTSCETPLQALASTSYYAQPNGHAYMRVYLNGPSGPPTEGLVGGLLEASIGRGLSEGPLTFKLPATASGCGQLNALFEKRSPSTTVSPSSPQLAGTTQADSPSGQTITIKIPQAKGAELATPALRSLLLRFAPGLTVSPPNVEGLSTCSPQAFGAGVEFATERHPLPAGKEPVEPPGQPHCPLQSQIATVEATTPLLERRPDGSDPLQGYLYVASPECEPCSQKDAEEGRLFPLFLYLADPERGVEIRLEGHAKLSASGQLTTVFSNQPQQPFEELVVHLKGGPRAPLANPQACTAPATSTAYMIPWSSKAPSAEEEALLSFSSAYALPSPSTFTPTCPPDAGSFSPSFVAGTAYPQAGAYTSFSLNLTRKDGEADLSAIETTSLTPGLTAKLAGVERCSEVQARAAACPPQSKVGTVTVGLGPGPDPFNEEGSVYLMGPTTVHTASGATVSGPFGLAILTPTKAGPFTLAGNTEGGAPYYLVRAAITINPYTTAVTTYAEALPTELDGVQLRYAHVYLNLNREGFMKNPTSCAPTPSGVSSTLRSAQGQVASAASPFDVGGCGHLSFNPSFEAITHSVHTRLQGAYFKVVVRSRPGEADIQKTLLTLPLRLPSRLSTLNKACPEKVFAEDPYHCPGSSFVGGAVARTPLLASPLKGPAIIVSHGGAAFPNLEILLSGEGVEVDLVGHTDIHKGITYSRFETLPDQPIESFEVVLPNGPHSLLSGNGNFCRGKLRIPTTLVGQNGAKVEKTTIVSVLGCKAKALARRRRAKARKASLQSPPSGPSAQGAASPRPAGQPQPPALPGARPLQLEGSCAAENTQYHMPEEEVRALSSNINPATGKPYSTQLPDCRAYELVSPAEMEGEYVGVVPFPTEVLNSEFRPDHASLLVGPSGEVAVYQAVGNLSIAETSRIEEALTANFYRTRRGANGWESEPALPSPAVLAMPRGGYQTSMPDFAPDLTSWETICGRGPAPTPVTCARRQGSGPWVVSPGLFEAAGTLANQVDFVSGPGQSTQAISGSGTVLVIAAELMTTPSSVPLTQNALYVLRGEGSEDVEVEVANLENNGETLLTYHNEPGRQEWLRSFGGTPVNIGSGASNSGIDGATVGYVQGAIPQDGETVFFTAQPKEGEAPETFIHTISKPLIEDLEAEGLCKERKTKGCTADLSRPQECKAGESRCEPEDENGSFFAGSADEGAVVFIVSKRELLPGAKGVNLYEFNLAAPASKRLSRLTIPQGQAEEGGFVSLLGVSEDSSRLYIADTSPLKEAEEDPAAPEGLRKPIGGAYNLYMIELASGKVHFIAPLAEADLDAIGAEQPKGGGAKPRQCSPITEGPLKLMPVPHCEKTIRAQLSRPNGQVLVFSVYTKLSEELKEGCKESKTAGLEVCEEQVYRYDASAPPQERLILVSHPAPGGRRGPGGSSIPTRESQGGRSTLSNEDAPDEFRVLNEAGNEILFTSNEPLSPLAQEGSHEQLYLWQEGPRTETGYGTVSLITGGSKSYGVGAFGMSASGNDIFFDSDEGLLPGTIPGVYTLYDARVNGGFLPPEKPPTCAGEECQGAPSAQPAAPTPPTATFSSGRQVSTALRLALKPRKKAAKRARRKRGRRHHRRKG